MAATSTPVAEIAAAPDPEAAAFLTDARAALAIPARRQPPARLLLADLSDMPDGPLPVRPDVMEWRLTVYADHTTALSRRTARKFAEQATACEATGIGIRQWHSCREAAVLSLLAAAEEAAPPEDRPWHAARLNLYATAHGLRGWYRTTLNGRHAVQVNHIRRRSDGERGRYHVLAGPGLGGAPRHCVIDRDSGDIAYRSHSDRIARQWIDEAEAPDQPAHQIAAA